MTALQLNAEFFRAMGKIADDETLMKKVLNYVGSHGRGCTLRDGERKSLLIKDVKTMEGALDILRNMENPRQ